MEHESLPPLQIIGEGVIQLWYNYDTYSKYYSRPLSKIAKYITTL